VAKKKIVVASVSSMKTFLTAELALHVEVPTAVASMLGPKVGEECWRSSLNARLRQY
jgi:hypothetical protein